MEGCPVVRPRRRNLLNHINPSPPPPPPPAPAVTVRGWCYIPGCIHTRGIIVLSGAAITVAQKHAEPWQGVYVRGKSVTEPQLSCTSAAASACMCTYADAHCTRLCMRHVGGAHAIARTVRCIFTASAIQHGCRIAAWC